MSFLHHTRRVSLTETRPYDESENSCRCLKQHRNIVAKRHAMTNAAVEHAQTTYHEINWENAHILATERNLITRHFILDFESTHCTDHLALNHRYRQIFIERSRLSKKLLLSQHFHCEQGMHSDPERKAKEIVSTKDLKKYQKCLFCFDRDEWLATFQ